MNIVSVLQDGVVTASDPVVPTFYYTSLNNPARTEVTDDFGNWLATFTNGSRTVTHRGPQRTFVEYAKGVHDTFDRSVLDGWGVTERSGVWYTTGGPNADFSVSSSMGHMSCNTLGIARRASVSNILQDIDATVMFRSDKTAVGDQQLAGIMFAYQGIDDHYLARIRFTPAVITDTFDRVTASGWGSANSGQSWSTSGGTSTDYSTTGTTGVHSLNTLNISRRTVLSSTSATNFDVAVRVKTSALASGASQVAAILGRYVDSNNHYIFRIRAASTSGHELFSSIQKPLPELQQP